MDIAESIITIIYYALIGFVAAILIYNLAKERRWEKEVLYAVVLVPFLLRLFMLK